MQPELSGATRMHFILGDPIAQVRSPAYVTQAFVERGANALLAPINVVPADLDRFMAAVGLARNVDGLIVTVPHKFACFAHTTHPTDRAKFLGAVNVMRRTRNGWAGDMVDGLGFVGAMIKKGVQPEGKRTLLVGAGGAGTAIALSMLEAGVAELAIHDADTDRRDNLIGRLAARFPAKVAVGSTDPTGFDIVANATPMGMRAEDPLPVQVDKFKPGMFVGCVITAPAVSPMVQAARAIGCPTQVGADMFDNLLSLMVDFLLSPVD